MANDPFPLGLIPGPLSAHGAEGRWPSLLPTADALWAWKLLSLILKDFLQDQTSRAWGTSSPGGGRKAWLLPCTESAQLAHSWPETSTYRWGN